MKALIKILVYAIVASMAFWGCDLSSNVSFSEEQNNAEIEQTEQNILYYGGPEGCVREMEFIYIPIPPIADELADESLAEDLADEPIANDLADDLIDELETPIADSSAVPYKRVKSGKKCGDNCKKKNVNHRNASF